MFGNEVDFAPLVNAVLMLLGTVLTAVATWVGAVIRKRFKFAADLDAGVILNAAIDRAISFARKSIIGADGKMTIQIQHGLVALAARYLVDKVPETLKHFGITEASLREMILARLDNVVDVDIPTSVPSDYQVPNAE